MTVIVSLVFVAFLLLCTVFSEEVHPYSFYEAKNGFPSLLSGHERRLLQSPSPASRANLVVAQDGSGNYRTIREALDAAGMRRRTGRFIIYVKAGTYQEYLVVGVNLNNIMLVGDGREKTIITGSRSADRGGHGTYGSATVGVNANDFIAQGITFRNTAGPQNYQAVALRSTGHRAVFYQCGFEGYQDTLYAHAQDQFYRDCEIYGTVDFIFGNAPVVIQNSVIYVRRPLSHQKNTITAHGRNGARENTGIIIQNSRIMAADDLRPVLGSVQTFLGRPWQKYSRTVYINCVFDDLVDPAGWLEWNGDFALATLFYGEYRNSGAGASTARRVKWPGYHVITSPSEASQFTIERFLEDGGSWLPSTGVPFTPGL
ncbi:pectinesterase 2-like [Aristolochia californica]|uniref:pectinesterase 2-like n=1 Tax=Aristolochia californica TaxID=171875 RepID=UPI0035DB66C0